MQFFILHVIIMILILFNLTNPIKFGLTFTEDRIYIDLKMAVSILCSALVFKCDPTNITNTTNLTTKGIKNNPCL